QWRPRHRSRSRRGADRAVPAPRARPRRLRPGALDRPLGGGGARRDDQSDRARGRWAGDPRRAATGSAPAWRRDTEENGKSAYEELTARALERPRQMKRFVLSAVAALAIAG